MAPAPISWPPSEDWDGDNGPWSTFSVRVGDPDQVVRVLPSTAGQATWVVTPQGCSAEELGAMPYSTCAASRGGLFNSSQSRTWDLLGNYSLGLGTDFGYDDSGTYGLDTVSVGFSELSGGPTLKSQVVTGIATYDYYVGMLGLGNQGTNLTTFNETKPSLLTALRSHELIPSLSWAYTAGAKYQSRGFSGSLTLGGYDSSRFIPNNVSFSLAPDISRDLVISLKTITTNVTSGMMITNSTQSLLLEPILTFIDSTQPYIYLPIEACQAFESAFGLEWNETAQVYWVNDTLHQTLLRANPTITFGIGDPQGGPNLDIAFPYASFDLQAIYPAVQDTTGFFPLQRATNESQYTLGRTFLQEAYLITDYERSNFSISQCIFDDIYLKTIVAIPSATANPHLLQQKTIIGISIGVVSSIILVILAIIIVTRKRRQRRGRMISGDGSRTSMPSANPNILTVCSMREIDDNSMCGPVRELPDSGKAELLDEQSPSGSGNVISEMPQLIRPSVHELRSHVTSRGHSMVQTRTAKTDKIFTSTGISQSSWTSFASSDNTPCVETIISASSQRNDFDDGSASVIMSNFKSEFYSLYLRKSLNLDRSLPPTPISESPQTSLVFVSFDQGTSFRPRPRMVQAPARGSMSAIISQKVPVSRYSAALNKHRRYPATVCLTGLETVVPPGHSDPTSSTISDNPRRHGKTESNWL